jgi:hypothetical protein
MGTLTFRDRKRHFDGECVRFKGYDGDKEVMCGVTVYALKHHEPGLPLGGLLPADVFIAAYDDLIDTVRACACDKYAAAEFEKDGDVRIVVHDRDWDR